MRNLPSYQNFRNIALIHCSLLSINEINSSVAVAVVSLNKNSIKIELINRIYTFTSIYRTNRPDYYGGLELPQGKSQKRIGFEEG